MLGGAASLMSPCWGGGRHHRPYCDQPVLVGGGTQVKYNLNLFKGGERGAEFF